MVGCEVNMVQFSYTTIKPYSSTTTIDSFIVNKVGVTPRLRIGIDRDKTMDLADYVLSTVDQTSKQIMQESYVKANDLIEKFIAGELCQDTTI